MFVAIGLVLEFMMSVSPQNYSASDGSPTTFNFREELPEGRLRDVAGRMFAINACQITAASVNVIYFVLFWHRNDRTHLRSGISLGLSVVAVAFASINLALQSDLAKAPLDREEILRRRPELTTSQLDEMYGSWLKAFRLNSRQPFVLNTIMAVIQMAAIAFWLWFLPARCRLPNRYLPVVTTTGWWRGSAKEGLLYSQISLVDNPDASSTGPLAAIFDEHEKARDVAQTTKSEVSLQGPTISTGLVHRC